MEYDPVIIKTFAKKLYSMARSILVSYSVLGAILGVVAGGVLGDAVGSSSSSMFYIVGLVIGGVFGYALATSKAFRLKLEAQIALAQVQIEENTRSN